MIIIYYLPNEHFFVCVCVHNTAMRQNGATRYFGNSVLYTLYSTHVTWWNIFQISWNIFAHLSYCYANTHTHTQAHARSSSLIKEETFSEIMCNSYSSFYITKIYLLLFYYVRRTCMHIFYNRWTWPFGIFEPNLIFHSIIIINMFELELCKQIPMLCRPSAFLCNHVFRVLHL